MLEEWLRFQKEKPALRRALFSFEDKYRLYWPGSRTRANACKLRLEPSYSQPQL